jgi:CDP-diacylglycerol--glycerol-3-phosphate 3-phosphatidyltransferase
MVIFLLLTQNDSYFLALVLFFAAGITDYIDGFLARKFSQTSSLGEILDPIADKILIIFLFFGLAVNLSSYFIGFVASLVISREIWVGALRDFNSRNNNVDATKVIFLAKIKTTVQLFTIFIYLSALALNKMFFIIIGDIFMMISLLITVYTGYIYTLNTFK